MSFHVMSYPIPIDLLNVKDRLVDALSGGELQRFAIAVTVAQQADM